MFIYLFCFILAHFTSRIQENDSDSAINNAAYQELLGNCREASETVFGMSKGIISESALSKLKQIVCRNCGERFPNFVIQT